MAENSPPQAGLTPLLVNAKGAATMCALSKASWARLFAAGKTPAPVRLGGSVRWAVEDIQAWIRLGCPGRSEFDALRSEAVR